MANTRHTGIPILQWVGAYPPCTPSVVISADLNPFCSGDSVMFTPTLNCVENVIIASYAWMINGVIKSTSPDPFVTSELNDGDRVNLLFITPNGNTYFSNTIVVQEKTEGCEPEPEPALELTFDDMDFLPVADAYSASDWNTFFDLPANGNPFTSVEVVGNMVKLIGGSEITLIAVLGFNPNILSVIDNGCITELSENCFYIPLDFYSKLANVIFPLITEIPPSAFLGCMSLTSITETNFPLVTKIQSGAFDDCRGLDTISFPLATIVNGVATFAALSPIIPTITINLPSCLKLGNSTGDDDIFNGVAGYDITLTVPSALMTVYGGSPDGDIQSLQSNNTVTIVTV